MPRMAKSASKKTLRVPILASKGPEATRLRARKFSLVRKHRIPEDLFGGALCRSVRRCGKASCHCAAGDGHPMWSLTLSIAGKKRVETIPDESIVELEGMMARGRTYLDAVAEVRAINAELLRLWKRERRRKKQR